MKMGAHILFISFILIVYFMPSAEIDDNVTGRLGNPECGTIHGGYRNTTFVPVIGLSGTGFDSESGFTSK